MTDRNGWVAYSSYDLTDRRDGASQHLAEVFVVQGPALSAEMVAMKHQDGWPRTSLGHALWIATRQIARWPWRRRDQRRGLLLGMHSLLLAPFFAPGLYVPLDCWSAREAGLATRSSGFRGLLRRTYALAVSACEHLLLHKASRILVVSQPEKDAYVARFPSLADRVMILPLRVPKVGIPATPPPPGPDCAVLVWMDARVGYGLESVLTCLSTLEAWPELQVTILSRMDDLGVSLGRNRRNLAFAEDLDDLLRQQALIILPDSFGSGIKNRALEVAIRGIPMLATPFALEGLGWSPAEHFAGVYSNEAEFRFALEAFLERGGAERAERLRDRIATEAASVEAQLLALLEDL